MFIDPRFSSRPFIKHTAEKRDSLIHERDPLLFDDHINVDFDRSTGDEHDGGEWDRLDIIRHFRVRWDCKFGGRETPEGANGGWVSIWTTREVKSWDTGRHQPLSPYLVPSSTSASAKYIRVRSTTPLSAVTNGAFLRSTAMFPGKC